MRYIEINEKEYKVLVSLVANMSDVVLEPRRVLEIAEVDSTSSDEVAIEAMVCWNNDEARESFLTAVAAVKSLSSLRSRIQKGLETDANLTKSVKSLLTTARSKASVAVPPANGRYEVSYSLASGPSRASVSCLDIVGVGVIEFPTLPRPGDQISVSSGAQGLRRYVLRVTTLNGSIQVICN